VPCCADIGKQELPTRALATVTRDRTSDVSKLVALLHLAPTAACKAERQAVLPVWHCRSQASSAPMPQQVTAGLDLTQTAGCCEAVSASQYQCSEMYIASVDGVSASN